MGLGIGLWGDLDFGLGFVGEFRFDGFVECRWEKSGNLLGKGELEENFGCRSGVGGGKVLIFKSVSKKTT